MKNIIITLRFFEDDSWLLNIEIRKLVQTNLFIYLENCNT